jgi:hypothetical protein
MGSRASPRARGMICPCCFETLQLASNLPVPVAPTKPGDLYCFRCRWFFAREMIYPEGTMALDGIWRCPEHGRKERVL